MFVHVYAGCVCSVVRVVREPFAWINAPCVVHLLRVCGAYFCVFIWSVMYRLGVHILGSCVKCGSRDQFPASITKMKVYRHGFYAV